MWHVRFQAFVTSGLLLFGVACRSPVTYEVESGFVGPAVVLYNAPYCSSQSDESQHYKIPATGFLCVGAPFRPQGFRVVVEDPIDGLVELPIDVDDDERYQVVRFFSVFRPRLEGSPSPELNYTSFVVGTRAVFSKPNALEDCWADWVLYGERDFNCEGVLEIDGWISAEAAALEPLYIGKALVSEPDDD